MNALFYFAAFLASFMLIPQASLAVEQNTVVRYPRPKSIDDVRDVDMVEVLRTSLQKTEASEGPFSLQPSATVMSSLRAHTELKNGKHIEVIFETVTEKFENMFIPIRIPVRKGLLGFRVFLIRHQDQHIFANINTLDELTYLSVGQGQGWTDVKILENNGFQVTTGTSYEGLFQMLVAGRFDFFSRGINEALVEYKTRKNQLPDLWLDNSLLLYYPFPKYIYVSKKNPMLAERIEKGLNIMIKDGSFDSIIQKYHGDMIEDLKLRNRKLITIENNLLPSTVPLDRKELWFNPFID